MMTDTLTRNLATTLTAITVLTLACARANSGVDEPHGSDSLAEQSTTVNLVGDWLLRADPPLPPEGLRITVTVDSAGSSTLFGRISHFFSGDVGTDPREFMPFTGSIALSGAVAFTIEKRDPTLPGLSLVGQIVGDTLRCHRLVLGPDTLTGGNRSWLFVKESC
jgi:hypothetical protein